EGGGRGPGEDPATGGAGRGGAGRLDADEPHAVVLDEVVEHADRVRAAADAGDDGLWEAALDGDELLARLAAYHAWHPPHELGMRRGPDTRADHVVRRLD